MRAGALPASQRAKRSGRQPAIEAQHSAQHSPHSTAHTAQYSTVQYGTVRYRRHKHSTSSTGQARQYLVGTLGHRGDVTSRCECNQRQLEREIRRHPTRFLLSSGPIDGAIRARRNHGNRPRWSTSLNRNAGILGRIDRGGEIRQLVRRGESRRSKIVRIEMRQTI